MSLLVQLIAREMICEKKLKKKIIQSLLTCCYAEILGVWWFIRIHIQQWVAHCLQSLQYVWKQAQFHSLFAHQLNVFFLHFIIVYWKRLRTCQWHGKMSKDFFLSINFHWHFLIVRKKEVNQEVYSKIYATQKLITLMRSCVMSCNADNDMIHLISVRFS